MQMRYDEYIKQNSELTSRAAEGLARWQMTSMKPVATIDISDSNGATL